MAEDLEQEESSSLLVAIFKYGIHYGILDIVMKMKNFGKRLQKTWRKRSQKTVTIYR